MGIPSSFCGIQMKVFAQSVAIVGIILSCLSLILNIFSWNYFPMTVSLLVAFILVLFGLNKNRPGYLLAAIIILGANLIIDFFLLISALYIGITIPPEFFDNFDEKQFYANWGDAEQRFRISYFIYAFILVTVIGLLVFATLIFYMARSSLLENLSSLVPAEARRESAPHFGYFSNLPMYSQNDRNSVEQIHVQAHNKDSSRIHSQEVENNSVDTKNVDHVLTTI